jgi:transcriptional regulator with XRE-family HTH domain
MSDTDTVSPTVSSSEDPQVRKLREVRRALDISQEKMAQILGVSYASINRWEQGRAYPTGTTLDVYLALQSALANGASAGDIVIAANSKQRGIFLLELFMQAYGQTGQVGQT